MKSVLRKPLSESEVLRRVREMALDCGEPRSGAFSRIAEYLQAHTKSGSCSITTVKNCLLGIEGWRFSEERIKLLGDMITEGFSLERKFSSGRPRIPRK